MTVDIILVELVLEALVSQNSLDDLLSGAALFEKEQATSVRIDNQLEWVQVPFLHILLLSTFLFSSCGLELLPEQIVSIGFIISKIEKFSES